MGAYAKPKKLNSAGLWEYALRIMGRRAHSANELRQKLSGRAELASDVPDVMGKLQQYGLTDDNKFSEAFATSRLQNQGLGSSRVFRELRAKRVSENIAAEAIAKAYSGTSEPELIETFLRRRYRSRNLAEFLKEEKNLASVYRRLRTAGFSSSASIAALKRHATAVEEWTEPEEEERE